MNAIKKKRIQIQHFLNEDVWQFKYKDLPKRKAWIIKIFRIILLTIRGFKKDDIPSRAAILTFMSLMSIVPVFAMGFGIAKGFGLEEILEKQLNKALVGQEEVINYILTFSRSMIQNTQGGVIAGIGLSVLIYTIWRLLYKIEESFNHIWEEEQERSFKKKFTDYLSIMLVAPILVILSSSVTVFITTQLKLITEEVAILDYISPIILFFIKLAPYYLIWLALTMIYIIMPNTRVKLLPATIAGVISGTIYQFLQWTYITFQFFLGSRYGAIYGSFAALPLFLLWMQLSWYIILLGSEIAYAVQNVDSFEFKNDDLEMSNNYKRLLSLLVTHLLVKNFIEGKRPITKEAICRKLETPIRFVSRVIDELLECRILSATVVNENEKLYYQPAQDPNILSIAYILEKLDKRGFENVVLKHSSEFNTFLQAMDKFRQDIHSSEFNKLLKDI